MGTGLGAGLPQLPLNPKSLSQPGCPCWFPPLHHPGHRLPGHCQRHLPAGECTGALGVLGGCEEMGTPKPMDQEHSQTGLQENPVPTGVDREVTSSSLHSGPSCPTQPLFGVGVVPRHFSPSHRLQFEGRSGDPSSRSPGSGHKWGAPSSSPPATPRPGPLPTPARSSRRWGGRRTPSPWRWNNGNPPALLLLLLPSCSWIHCRDPQNPGDPQNSALGGAELLGVGP